MENEKIKQDIKELDAAIKTYNQVLNWFLEKDADFDKIQEYIESDMEEVKKYRRELLAKIVS